MKLAVLACVLVASKLAAAAPLADPNDGDRGRGAEPQACQRLEGDAVVGVLVLGVTIAGLALLAFVWSGPRQHVGHRDLR